MIFISTPAFELLRNDLSFASSRHLMLIDGTCCNSTKLTGSRNWPLHLALTRVLSWYVHLTSEDELHPFITRSLQPPSPRHPKLTRAKRLLITFPRDDGFVRYCFMSVLSLVLKGELQKLLSNWMLEAV